MDVFILKNNIQTKYSHKEADGNRRYTLYNSFFSLYIFGGVSCVPSFIQSQGLLSFLA